MTVWCVMDSDWEGSYLCSIWSTQELAQAELDRQDWNDKYHSIEEWDVDREIS